MAHETWAARDSARGWAKRIHNCNLSMGNGGRINEAGSDKGFR
jgi:hypothetical protein